MQHLPVTIVWMLGFSSLALALEAKTPAVDLDAWASGVLTSLTKDCATLKRKDWILRYGTLSAEVMNQLKTVTQKQYNAHAPESPLREVVEVLFYQHLPEGKIKNPANLCSEPVWSYVNAESKSEVQSAVDQFEACNGDRYRSVMPAVVTRTLACWKQIKE